MVRWIDFLAHFRTHTAIENAGDSSGNWRLEPLNLRIGPWKLLDWIDSGGEFCGFVWYDGWCGWYVRADKVAGNWMDCTLFVCPVPFFPFARSWSWAWRYEGRK